MLESLCDLLTIFSAMKTVQGFLKQFTISIGRTFEYLYNLLVDCLYVIHPDLKLLHPFSICTNLRFVLGDVLLQLGNSYFLLTKSRSLLFTPRVVIKHNYIRGISELIASIEHLIQFSFQSGIFLWGCFVFFAISLWQYVHDIGTILGLQVVAWFIHL